MEKEFILSYGIINNKFTKQHFIKAMEYIISGIERDEEFDLAIQKYTNDDNFSGFFMNDDRIVDLLKDIMNDKNDWIGYFLYERGRKFTKKNIISDNDGKNIPFRNMNDLYNLITR